MSHTHTRLGLFTAALSTVSFPVPSSEPCKMSSLLFLRACAWACSVIKLMINDITSMWQTDCHGDTTLNKHYVLTGRVEEGKREEKGGEEQEMKKMEDEEEDSRLWL